MRRITKKTILYFMLGCFCGLLLDYLYHKMIDSKPKFIGHNTSPSRYHVNKNAIFNDLKYLYDDNDKNAAVLSQSVRILCWVTTQDSSLLFKAQAVKDTWGKRCNILIIFSSKDNKDFPAIALNTPEGYEHLWLKTKAAWQYVYKHYLNDVDWFVKADDDTFLIVENLRYFLSKFKTTDAHYFGRNFKYLTNDYNSGGAGYIFSKETLKRFIRVLDRCEPKSKAEDIAVGTCLAEVEVYPGETRDRLGKETFHPFAPDFHLIPGAIEKTNWLHQFNKWEVVSGPGCCSSQSIAFHYTTPKRMYLFYYYLYRVQKFS